MERRQAGDDRRRPRPDAAVYPVAAGESPESILPGLPRVGSLDALLREVDSLRLTLETDLTYAAAAVEAGQTELAADILDNDRTSLRGFEARALGHLRELAGAPTALEVRRRRLRVPAMPFVAAAAVAGFLLGVVPQLTNGSAPESTTAVSATTSLDALQEFAAQGDTAQVRAAANNLHEQLLSAVANAGNDPLAAQQALLMLSYERDAIVMSGDSALLHDVLASSTALTNRIRAGLPAIIRHRTPTAPALVLPAPTATPQSSSSPSPKPKPSATATAKASATPSASASASPSPSSSPSNPAVLPTGAPKGP